MRRLIAALVALGLVAQAAAQSLDFGARGQAAKALARRPMLPSNRGTFIMTPPQFVSGGATNMAGQTWTFLTTLPVPCGFYAWRPIFGNWTTGTSQVGGVVAQSSTTVSDYIHPTGGGAWSYNSALNAGALSGGNVDLPRDGAASLAASGYPLTVAAAANDPVTGSLIPAFAAGDWNTIPSLDATDGTNAHYLMVRTLISPQNPWGGAIQIGASGWTGVPAINAGYDYAPAPFRLDDRVTDTSATATTFGNNTVVPLLGIQFLSERPVVTVGMVGDSHMAGQATAQGIAPFATRATLQLNTDTGLCFSPVNAAWGGATSDRYWPTARAIFSFAKPQIVFVQGWTANDPNTTQAAVDKSLARMLAIAEQVRGWGGVPILVTPFPRDAATMANAAILAQWQYLRGRLLNARSHGALVLDAGAVLGNVSTGTYLAGMSGDAIHPNDAGHGALVGPAKALIRRALGI